MTKLETFIDYVGAYRSDDPDSGWWYCITDKQVYGTPNLYEEFGYSSKGEIYETGLYLEFPKIDRDEFARAYLRLLLGKDYQKDWMAVPDEEFKLAFRIFIENNNLLYDFFEYEKKELLPVLEEWCSKNGISIN